MRSSDVLNPTYTRRRGVAPVATIDTLQLGMSWFPEQAGNGLDRVYHALVHHLPKAGVNVRGLVVGTDRVGADSQGRVSSFAGEEAPLLNRWWGARNAVKSHIRRGAPDLVASHFALYTAPVLDLLGGLPLVVHFHGPWAQEGRVEGESATRAWVKDLLERSVYSRGDRFVVLSDAFREELCTQFRVPVDRVRVVPGGVDTTRFDTGMTIAKARERLGWPQGRPIVLAVRRLARRMGLEGLIDAVDVVRERVPDILLLIAGRGALADELQARIRAAGLGQHVRLLGFVAEGDLAVTYRAANLTVVPTVALEGFGLVTVESLAAGTPVLVTPNGGLPEVVRGLSPDLVLPSTEAMAEGLVGALRGGVPLPSSEECQGYARSRFDWSAVALRTRAVYEEVS